MIVAPGWSALAFKAAISASSASTTIRSAFPFTLSPTVNCHDIFASYERGLTGIDRYLTARGDRHAPRSQDPANGDPARARAGGRHRRSSLAISKASTSSRTASSRSWRQTCKARGLPRVSFHALRHTHASTLIRAGVDILTISRRLGHSGAAMTLDVYGHLIEGADAAAAKAIEGVLK
jgi:integrase